MACSGCPRCEPRTDLLAVVRQAFEKSESFVRKLQAFGDSEDGQVLRLELDDAREDLNDALRTAATLFEGVLPGRVPLLDGELAWNGKDLCLLKDGRWSSLVTTPLKYRMGSASVLQALYDECTRKRGQ